MANPTAAMLVIGDEILSGRTRDANMHHLARRLAQTGIDLREARVVPDDEDAIVEAVKALSARHDHVFTSGGIGPTHDDITAEALARAFGVGIDVRDDARQVLADYYRSKGEALTEARLRMARVPDGARLIENSVSGAPGFRLGNVMVMAGVPQIFEAMLDVVLASLPAGSPLVSASFSVARKESEIADDLRDVALANDDVRIGSYPAPSGTGGGVNVVVRAADEKRLRQVVARLREVLGAEG